MKVAIIDTKLGPFRPPVYNILKDKGYDIVMTAKNKEQYLNLPYLFLKPRYFPFFAHGWCPSLWKHLKEKDYDVLIACDAALSHTWLTYLYCKKYHKKFILWSEAWQWSTILKAKFALPIIKRIIRGANALIATGNKARKFLVKHGAMESKVFIAPNSAEDLKSRVNPKRVEEIRKEYKLHNYTTFLCVSRLIVNKGIDTVVKAFNQMPHDCKLLIVGDAETSLKSYRGSEKYAKTCKDDSDHPGIIWTGSIPYDDLPNFYATCDVFMLASKFTLETINPSESWGMVVNEAMSIGKPIIISSAAGASDDLVDKSNGVKFMGGDADSLLDAMKKIKSKDLELMGNASRMKIEERFTFENMAKGFMDAVGFVNGKN